MQGKPSVGAGPAGPESMHLDNITNVHAITGICITWDLWTYEGRGQRGERSYLAAICFDVLGV